MHQLVYLGLKNSGATFSADASLQHALCLQQVERCVVCLLVELVIAALKKKRDKKDSLHLRSAQSRVEDKNQKKKHANSSHCGMQSEKRDGEKKK